MTFSTECGLLPIDKTEDDTIAFVRYACPKFWFHHTVSPSDL